MTFDAGADAAVIHALIDGLPIGVCLIDDQRRIVSWNLTLARWTGRPSADAIGEVLTQLFPNLHAPWCEDRLRQVFTAGCPAVFTSAFHPHFIPISLDGPESGRLMVQETRVQPLPDRPGLAMITIQDVTRQVGQTTTLRQERVRLQAAHTELAQANTELAAANRELDQFVHTASHDLKSPLLTITGFVGHLRRAIDRRAYERADGLLGRITAAAAQMNRRLDDLLELSRAGRMLQEPRPVALDSLVTTIVDRHRPLVETLNATIQVDPSLPVLHADPDRIDQILDNLLTNAMKYGCADRLGTIEVGCERIDDELRLFVRDDGPGIDPRFHAKIFGLFERLHSTHNGSGVGLALVHRVATAYGGRAWVESEPGTGATFWIAFPMSMVADERQQSRGTAA